MTQQMTVISLRKLSPLFNGEKKIQIFFNCPFVNIKLKTMTTTAAERRIDIGIKKTTHYRVTKDVAPVDHPQS